MGIINLNSSFEQIKLNEFITTNDVFNYSIKNRMLSAITFPFHWIATSIENLTWRIIDPNWKAFVVKGRGHFVKDKHHGTFSQSLTKMEEIFKAHIDTSPAVKEWQLIHENKRPMEDSNQVWLRFSSQYGGTCFGNCVSLAYHIMKAGKPLAIDDLKKIEKSEILVKTAQAVQLVTNSAVEYNKTILSNGLEELKKTTTLKERLESLDLTVENYENHSFKDRIKELIDSGITKNDLPITVEKLINSAPVHFAPIFRSLKTRVLQKHVLIPGLNLIKQFNLLSLERMSEISTIQVAEFKGTLTQAPSPLTAPDFKGVMLIAGIPIKGQNGHVTLLEIDNEKKMYIFYDNNRGYYQWNDLQSCLLGIEKRLKSERYGSCEIVLNPLIPSS